MIKLLEQLLPPICSQAQDTGTDNAEEYHYLPKHKAVQRDSHCPDI